MPILSDIFNKIPANLLEFAGRNPPPDISELSSTQVHLIKQLDSELADFLNELPLYLNNPQDPQEFSALLTLIISPNYYKYLAPHINALNQTNWMNNKNKSSAIHQLHIAFLKKHSIEQNKTKSIHAEIKQIEENLNAHKNQLCAQIKNGLTLEVNKEIERLSIIRNTLPHVQKFLAVNDIFKKIPINIFLLLKTNPPPPLSNEQQKIIDEVSNDLVNLSKKIESASAIKLNSDDMLILLSEVLQNSEFYSYRDTINKLLNSHWLRISGAAACLTAFHVAFLNIDAIHQQRQLSLNDTIKDLKENGVKKREEREFSKKFEDKFLNDPILSHLKNKLFNLRKLLHSAELIEKMVELPSETRNKPEYKTLLHFENKLKEKVASLIQDETHEQYTQNKRPKILLLQSILDTINLYKIHALSFNELLERIQKFQADAEQFEHTNPLKVFFNKKLPNLFTVNTKQLLDDFYQELQNTRFRLNK